MALVRGRDRACPYSVIWLSEVASLCLFVRRTSHNNSILTSYGKVTSFPKGIEKDHQPRSRWVSHTNQEVSGGGFVGEPFNWTKKVTCISESLVTIPLDARLMRLQSLNNVWSPQHTLGQRYGLWPKPSYLWRPEHSSRENVQLLSTDSRSGRNSIIQLLIHLNDLNELY